MQQPLKGFPPRRVDVNPTFILSLIQKVAQHNYDLGLKVGYRKGRLDERERRPWDPEIRELPDPR